MANVRGQDGSVVIASNTVAELRSFSLSGVTIETIDDTVKGDSHRTFKGGVADGGTASFQCWYDGSDTAQAAIIDYFGTTVQSTVVTCTFQAATGKYWSFDGLPQSYNANSPEGSGLVDIGFVFKVSGAVTETWG